MTLSFLHVSISVIMDIKISCETEHNLKSIDQFVKTAFETAHFSDGKEVELIRAIRSSPSYIPELTFVATLQATIVGYVMLSKTIVSNHDAAFTGLLLAPLCTQVNVRNQNLGSFLVKTALNKAVEMGYSAVFLVGDRQYYKRFGFVPASTYQISCNLDIPTELMDNVMALELVPDALKGVRGTVSLGD